MSFDNILFEKTDGYAAITLNRPDKLNSFNTELHGELKAALKEVAKDDAIRALLLTGAGRAFCAGQDLSDRALSEGDEPRDLGATLPAGDRTGEAMAVEGRVDLDTVTGGNVRGAAAAWWRQRDAGFSTARTDTGIIMGLRDRKYPVEGVQFHPESFLTVTGKRLLANFLNL